ncbi:MAG: methyltransferase [Balneolaceae bacterium]|nr:methyltransferase [Balneolaceae bacterium]
MFTTFKFQDQVIKLQTKEGVFQPTTTTRYLLNQIESFKGKSVLDLGCGLGPIAITAALSGAKKVVAVDIMEEACRATEQNLVHNKVEEKVEVYRGDLFDPLGGMEFDIIVDDVSGMAEEVSRISSWYPEPIPTGGYDGTEPTVKMLKQAPGYLAEQGYLLFPVISLSDSAKIIETAEQVYGSHLELLVRKSIPFNEELMKNLDMLEKLKKKGLIDFEKVRSRYMWNLSIYKAEAH